MRELTDHIVEGDSANHQLKIEVLDEPGQGNANHVYKISGLDLTKNELGMNELPDLYQGIIFQNGPIREVGVNGMTHEALLAILIDRLKGFQSGPFKSPDNKRALQALRAALGHLQNRTRERLARGVEGTHVQ